MGPADLLPTHWLCGRAGPSPEGAGGGGQGLICEMEVQVGPAGLFHRTTAWLEGIDPTSPRDTAPDPATTLVSSSGRWDPPSPMSPHWLLPLTCLPSTCPSTVHLGTLKSAPTPCLLHQATPLLCVRCPQEKPTRVAMAAKDLLFHAAWPPTARSPQSHVPYPPYCPAPAPPGFRAAVQEARPPIDLPPCLHQHWSFPLQSLSLRLHQVFPGSLRILVLMRAPFESTDHVPGTQQRDFRATSCGIVPLFHDLPPLCPRGLAAESGRILYARDKREIPD